MVELVEADFHVLSDQGGLIASEYGVFDLHGDGVAAPATFVITPDGEIAAYHLGQNINDRPTADQILAQVDLLVR